MKIKIIKNDPLNNGEEKIFSINRQKYPGEILKDIENELNKIFYKWIVPDDEDIISEFFEKSLIKVVEETDESFSNYEFKLILWKDNKITLLVLKDEKVIYKNTFDNDISYGKNI